nr:transcriptional regulator war1 [Quercus suber]
MATSVRRSRACEACHSIKIKCELGSNGALSPPCERCVRLGKECVVTTPVRHKDRVAELEAKVEALTRLLEAQGLNEFRPRQSDEIPADVVQADARAARNNNQKKRRRLDDVQHRDAVAPTAGLLSEQQERLLRQETGGVDEARLASLDAVLTLEQQQTLLDKYRDQVTSLFPLVLIAREATLHDLRTNKPHLLLAVIYAACQEMLSQDQQEEIARILMPTTASLIFGTGDKNLELLQTIQIICLWYRSPKHHKTITLYQFVTLAHGIALDLGLGGLHPEQQFGVANPHWEGYEQILKANVEETRRAWLVCHYLSSNMTVLLRRFGQQTWTPWHEECLTLLEYSSHAAPSDRLLCQIVRGERMCEEIALELQFVDQTIVHDVAAPVTKMKLHSLQNRIMAWSTQHPSGSQSPYIALWQHAVTLYLHESVLHTLGNKHNFSAPFVAERLSLTDFPTPMPVPAEHIASLQCLIFSGVAMIDLAETIDPAALIMSPGLMITTRFLYSLYVLVKVLIACTAPGNTFGTVIAVETLQLESCFAKMTRVAERATAIDNMVAPARILSAVFRVEAWYRSYIASLKGLANSQADLEAMAGSQPELFTDHSSHNLLDLQQPPVSMTDMDLLDWNDFLLMPDNLAMDFGLGGLFDQ